MQGSDSGADALVDALSDEAIELLAARLGPFLGSSTDEAGGSRWLDAREAAGYLGLSVAALHKLTASRAIPFEQDAPGSKLWFQRSELDRWRRGGDSTAGTAASKPLPRQREAAS